MILRCVTCGKDTKADGQGCCEHCAANWLIDRTAPHKPHWSRHTLRQMICKVCDRIISADQYISDPSKLSAECIPQEAVDKLAAIIDAP